MADLVNHWESVYAARNAHEVSWYQIRPDTSLRLIDKLGIHPTERIVDIGGGASSLVDRLLEQGFDDILVMDISTAALDAVKRRLGSLAQKARWLAGDITQVELPGPFKLWHDRAVFHFLTDGASRQRYVANLTAAVPPGGYAIMATFAEDGPERCSNLPVRRYSPEQLAAELGPGFAPIESLRETHVTPAGGEQKFIYCCFRRC